MPSIGKNFSSYFDPPTNRLPISESRWTIPLKASKQTTPAGAGRRVVVMSTHKVKKLAKLFSTPSGKKVSKKFHSTAHFFVLFLVLTSSSAFTNHKTAKCLGSVQSHLICFLAANGAKILQKLRRKLHFLVSLSRRLFRWLKRRNSPCENFPRLAFPFLCVISFFARRRKIDFPLAHFQGEFFTGTFSSLRRPTLCTKLLFVFIKVEGLALHGFDARVETDLRKCIENLKTLIRKFWVFCWNSPVVQ